MPLEPPPRDADGSVIPHDHAGVGDQDGIIRRISEEYIVPGAASNTRRISSKAFRASSGKKGGMSVDLEALIVESGADPRAYVTTPRFMGSIHFKAGQLRREGLRVGYDPLPSNPYHGEVWGGFTKGLQRRLQANANWFVRIPGVDLT